MFKPELLSPAGSLEKLKTAVTYGADAVYLGGLKFGLRTAAENFTISELADGVEFAHARGSKVYTVLNSFLHDRDLEELPEFLTHLSRVQVDGVIVSDLGVITTVAKHTSIPIHLSTQASCLNDEASLLWKELGVKRLILGREASIRDAKRIKDITGIEVELFIHGSMCMAYSGNCTISNFTQGRDSNRGGCAQSCRFSYELDFKDEKKQNTFFMSSKDLMGIEQIPLFFEAQIDSVKIEGRMRSALYAGMISKIYREAIDAYAESHARFVESLEYWKNELDRIPHREYASGNLESAAGENSVNKFSKKPEKRPEYEFVGMVKKVVGRQYLLAELKNTFTRGENVEVVCAKGVAISFQAENFQNALGEPLESVKPNTLVRLPYIQGVEAGNFLRKTVLT